MARNNLGLLLAGRGQTGEAIAEYHEILRIDPGYQEAHNNLGLSLAQLRRTGDAIAEYREALRIDPEYPEGHNNLGAALVQQGRIDEAIAEYREALRINPNYAPAHNNLGIVLAQQGRSREAIMEYRKVLEMAPDSVDVLNNLAWLLATSDDASLRDGKKAVQLAEKAEQLTKGNDPNTLDTLAAAFAEAGRFPEAVQTAGKALQLARTQSNTELTNALLREIKLYEAGHRFEEAH